MRIEAITKIKDVDDDGSPVRMDVGDSLTVGDTFGRRACKFGWARDLGGVINTGEQSKHPVAIKPQGTSSGSHL